MKIYEQEIEETLRGAPRPNPPPGLRELIISQIGPRPNSGANEGLRADRGSGGWVRRWWPTLAPAAASLACAAVIVVQQAEIRQLRQSIQGTAARAASLVETDATPVVANAESEPAEAIAADTEQEVARLKEMVSRLSAEVSELEAMRTENDTLRTQLSRRRAESLPPELAEASAKEKEHAEFIMCINNMKQLGLAARIWALDNNKIYPSNLLDMTNEMSTPKILWCPADRARQQATSFSDYTPANCSYEYLAPAGSDEEPWRVLFRCPIHGNIGLCDGSVQARVAKNHPEQLVERDGKLYYTPAVQKVPLTSPPGEPKQ